MYSFVTQFEMFYNYDICKRIAKLHTCIFQYHGNYDISLYFYISKSTLWKIISFQEKFIFFLYLYIVYLNK